MDMKIMFMLSLVVLNLQSCPSGDDYYDWQPYGTMTPPSSPRTIPQPPLQPSTGSTTQQMRLKVLMGHIQQKKK